MSASESEETLLFDYRTLRLIVGGIAFLFPWTVTFLASKITSSISASYHTDARDVFVGFLFIIGALLLAYKGHERDFPGGKGFWNWVRRHQEDLVSTAGGFATFFAALFPTACDSCGTNTDSIIHYIAAFMLFSTVVYFCLFAFMGRVISKMEGASRKITLRVIARLAFGRERVDVLHTRKVRRLRIYLLCGAAIAGIMLGLLAAQAFVPEETRTALRLTFWAEAIALLLFGIAWMTASQYWFFGDDRGKG